MNQCIGLGGKIEADRILGWEGGRGWGGGVLGGGDEEGGIVSYTLSS